MKARPSLVALVCTAAFLGLGGILPSAFAATTALAPLDKQKPTKPTNLHVTGTTAWSVSLAWNASTDNSGQVSYRVICSNGHAADCQRACAERIAAIGERRGRIFSPAGESSQSFQEVLVELRAPLGDMVKQRVGWTDRSGREHIVDYVEWHTVADILDRTVPDWSYTIRGLQQVGDLIVNPGWLRPTKNRWNACDNRHDQCDRAHRRDRTA